MKEGSGWRVAEILSSLGSPRGVVQMMERLWDIQGRPGPLSPDTSLELERQCWLLASMIPSPRVQKAEDSYMVREGSAPYSLGPYY